MCFIKCQLSLKDVHPKFPEAIITLNCFVSSDHSLKHEDNGFIIIEEIFTFGKLEPVLLRTNLVTIL